MNTVKKLQDLSRNRPWLTFLVLVTLGTMILFFLGCGSDSTPADGKKEKAAKSSGAVKSQAAMPLLSDKETGKVQKSPSDQRMEVAPGYTQEELDARMAEQRKKFEEYKANMEAAPGITQPEMAAKQAAQLKKFEEYKANMEMAPGITQEQLKAREAELRKQFAAYCAELDANKKPQVKPEGRDWFPPSAGK